MVRAIKYTLFGDRVLHLDMPFLAISSHQCIWLLNYIISLLVFYEMFLTLVIIFHVRNDSPTKGVLALNTNIVRVKRPLSYKLVWRSGPPQTNELQHSEKDLKNKPSNVDRFCSVWLPVAPVGYVALGCVSSTGTAEPPLSSVFCLSASLVSSCGLRDCIPLRYYEHYL